MRIEFPREYGDIARDIARLRSIVSGNVYAPGTDRYRGDKEERISWLGVMGELIGNYYLKKSKENGKVAYYECAPLLSFKPEPGPDFIITTAWYKGSTYRLDVKCTDGDVFNINRRNHDSNKDRSYREQIDSYGLIKLLDDNHASFEFVSHNDVNLWEIKTGFNDYYSRAVQAGL